MFWKFLNLFPIQLNLPIFSITVKPRYSAPTFNIIPPIEYTNFGSKKHFHGYLYIGNIENLNNFDLNNFDQSLEMRNSGV